MTTINSFKDFCEFAGSDDVHLVANIEGTKLKTITTRELPVLFRNSLSKQDEEKYLFKFLVVKDIQSLERPNFEPPEFVEITWSSSEGFEVLRGNLEAIGDGVEDFNRVDGNLESIEELVSLIEQEDIYVDFRGGEEERENGELHLISSRKIDQFFMGSSPHFEDGEFKYWFNELYFVPSFEGEQLAMDAVQVHYKGSEILRVIKDAEQPNTCEFVKEVRNN